MEDHHLPPKPMARPDLSRQRGSDVTQQRSKGGRPQGSKNRRTIVREVANETNWVKIDGEPMRLSILEIALLTLKQMAFDAPSSRAFEEYVRLLNKYRPESSSEIVGYAVAPAELSKEEFLAKLMEDTKDNKRPNTAATLMAEMSLQKPLGSGG